NAGAAATRNRADARGHAAGCRRPDRDRRARLLSRAVGRHRTALCQPRWRRRSAAPRADPPAPRVVKRPGREGRQGGAGRTLGTRSASDAVTAVLALHGITDQLRAGRVLTEWSDLVGPKIAQRTRPDGITDRTLWVEVATSAWLHELNLMRPQLLMGLI